MKMLLKTHCTKQDDEDRQPQIRSIRPEDDLNMKSGPDTRNKNSQYHSSVGSLL